MSGGAKSSKLFVANLSSKVKVRDLEDIFDKFGKIIDINLKEKKEKFAFIEFEDIRDAEDALERMNGYELFGKNIRIEYSHGGKKVRSERYPSTISNTACYICRQKGHWAKECPQAEAKGIVFGRCFQCGSSRHKITECPKYRRRNSSYSRSRSRSRSKSASHDKGRKDKEKKSFKRRDRKSVV